MSFHFFIVPHDLCIQNLWDFNFTDFEINHVFYLALGSVLVSLSKGDPSGCMQNPNLFCLCHTSLKLMIFLWCCCYILVLRKYLCVALTNLSACGVKAKKFHASWPSVCILTSPVCHIELGILNNYLITFSLRLALYSKRVSKFRTGIANKYRMPIF